MRLPVDPLHVGVVRGDGVRERVPEQAATGRWWVGERLDQLHEAHAGDFVFIPPYVVHREENASETEPVEMIIARSTQEAIVVNLDEPPAGQLP